MCVSLPCSGCCWPTRPAPVRFNPPRTRKEIAPPIHVNKPLFMPLCHACNFALLVGHPCVWTEHVVRCAAHSAAALPRPCWPSRHRVAASTLCCIAMRACSDLIMRLGADSVACGCGRRYRPVGGPCPAPTLTVPARLACDGRRLMVLLAIVIERCVQRSQNVPSIALQLPLPRACFHVLLPLHSLCPLRAGR